ncbi:MAG TPA: zf-HC2 domain-containing protein [Bryobacteraceae bacterium]|jgi:hypothetical protein|nr:zf-HC2 domain-containing protein [Bryobacteraceae bacterium]
MPALDRDGGTMKLQIADWSSLPDDRVLRAELRRVLDDAIAALAANYRSVVLLRDVEELTIDSPAIGRLSQDQGGIRACHYGTEECQRIFAALSEYLDLELPPEACRELEAHLAGCAPCIEFAESRAKPCRSATNIRRERCRPTRLGRARTPGRAWRRALAVRQSP